MRTCRTTRCLMSALLLGVLLTTSGAANDAGRELPFGIGMDARAIGFGNAYTALGYGPAAMYYNPSLLHELDFQSFDFMHADLFAGTIYNVAAWSYPLSVRDGVGIGAMRIGTGNITATEDYVELGEFDFSTTQFLLSYGREILPGVGLGGSFKILQQSLRDFSDFGIGLDIGVSCRPNRFMSIGVTAQDLITPELQLDATTESYPRSYRVGLALTDLPLGDIVGITAALDWVKNEERDGRWHAGGEVMIAETYALRGGYDADNAVFGGGLTIGRLQFDYAYRLQDIVDGTHNVSLTITVGRSIEDRIKQRELAALAASTEAERRRRFRQNRDRADEFFDNFQLDSALVYYQRALAFDETNDAIIGTIAAIEEARREQAEQAERLRVAQATIRQTIRNYTDQADRLAGRGFYRAALDVLDIVFDIEPANPQANQLRETIRQRIALAVDSTLTAANALLDSNRVAPAIEAYNRVLELDSTNTAARTGKARAFAAFDQAQQRERGIALFNAGRLREARGVFRALLEANPNDRVAPDYLERIAGLLQSRPQVNDTTTTAPTVTRDLTRDPVFWPIYLEGLRLFRSRQYDAAIERWERVLEAYPGHEDTQANIRQARLRIAAENGDPPPDTTPRD